MDVTKMRGIIDAIEAEAKQASPSHNNLARLTGMAFTELMDYLNKLSGALLPYLARQVAQTGLAIQSEQPPTAEAPVQEAPQTEKPAVTDEEQAPEA